MLKINNKLSLPLSELTVRFACSGGPGGQNVNKVASKATLHWDIEGSPSLSDWQRKRLLERIPPSYLTAEGVFFVSSSRERDQPRNRRDCEQKLTDLVRAALHVPKVRKPTRPSRAARERRLKNKKHRAQIKSMRRSDHD